jgi:hypothetical protein
MHELLRVTAAMREGNPVARGAGAATVGAAPCTTPPPEPAATGATGSSTPPAEPTKPDISSDTEASSTDSDDELCLLRSSTTSNVSRRLRFRNILDPAKLACNHMGMSIADFDAVGKRPPFST